MNVELMVMHEISLENYRCFGERQTARLAPLTLLVGENSSGKTSFLAMIQVLLDIAYSRSAPNFRKSPYDLGSFDEIAHNRGGYGGRANTFKAGFSACDIDITKGQQYSENSVHRFDMEFGRGSSTVPVPIYWCLSNQDAYIKEHVQEADDFFALRLYFGTSKRSWRTTLDSKENFLRPFSEQFWMPNLDLVFRQLRFIVDEQSKKRTIEALKGAKNPTSEDWEKILGLAQSFRPHGFTQAGTVFASAPIRSKPHRTYDPAHLTPGPEGDHISMYMANVFMENKNVWNSLQKSLEKFGQDSGLFDEISIKPPGEKGSEAFQLQIRKFGPRAKGPSRNLIDVGYGVSQVLPIVTELLLNGPSSMHLIQQPEVHLHPSAQAALGSLFCRIAQPERTLVVETHSDYILDRVRMEVRDGNSNLKPEDVSILFFERKNPGAQIHSLKIDNQGNIINAPDCYRQFFMEETRRSLGL